MARSSGRLKYSALNLSANWLNQLVIILFRFVNRAVFVRVLSAEYLGLSGLFSDVLAMLSLAELGVGAAIGFHLYKPLAEDDETAVAALMNLFRRIYTIIGVAVFAIGAVLTPLLPFLIKQMPDIPHIQIIYLLFVLNSSISYFFSYKGTLLSADQCGYIGTIISIVTNMVTTALQITLLLLTGNYILYLSVSVVFTAVGNFVMSRQVDRKYPYLRTDRRSLPSKRQIREIFAYTRAMMMHKIGSLAVNSTDNMIISKFIGLAVGGAYSNYVLLSTCLNKIIGQVFGAAGASVGNIGASEPLEKQKRIFNRLLLFDFWGYSYVMNGLLCVATPLIAACFGRQYEMAASIPALLAVNLYLSGMRRTVQTFNDGVGMLRHNRYAPLAEAAINLIVSIWLVQRIGLPGVIIGTTVSTVCVSLWAEPWVLFRYHFGESVLPYLLKLTGVTVVAAATAGLSWWLCQLVAGPLWLVILYRVIVCTLVSNGINWLLFGRTEEFKFYLGLLSSIKEKIRKQRV